MANPQPNQQERRDIKQYMLWQLVHLGRTLTSGKPTQIQLDLIEAKANLMALTLEKDFQAAITEAKREMVERAKACLPEEKVFKGGLDNGISDQIHGFNVCRNQILQALAKLTNEIAEDEPE